MNEWSHQGKYSGSEVTALRYQNNYQRSRWEESWDERRKMNNFRYKDFHPSCTLGHHYVTEDVCVPPTFSSKKKKHGASDPRFKRVINTEARGEMYPEVEREKVKEKVKNPGLISGGGFCKNFVEQKETATKDLGLSIPSNYIQASTNNGPFRTVREQEKVKKFSKTNLERSASDCTLRKKNIYGKNKNDEKVRNYPSATRLHKVHDWMKDYRAVPEKKRSVITVIGQTQTKPFSKVLHEINQRRKLAKELDKHALCEGIVDPEAQAETKDIVAKVDFVLPDGKLLYSTEKVFTTKDNKSKTDHYGGESYPKKSESLDNRENLRKRCEMIPERDSCFSSKKGKSKRSSKRHSSREERRQNEDTAKSLCLRFPRRLLWSFFLLLSLSLAFYASFYIYKPTKTFSFYDVFQTKPAPWYETLYDSWYERLLL